MTHGEAWYKNKLNFQGMETLDLENEMDKIVRIKKCLKY